MTIPRSGPIDRAAARWTASSERNSAGPRSPARSRSGSSSRTRLIAAKMRLTKADISTYAALPLIGAQLRQRDRRERRRGDRETHLVGDVQQVAVGLGCPAFEYQLIQGPGSQRDDPGDRVAVVGDLDRLAADDTL